MGLDSQTCSRLMNNHCVAVSDPLPSNDWAVINDLHWTDESYSMLARASAVTKGCDSAVTAQPRCLRIQTCRPTIDLINKAFQDDDINEIDSTSMITTSITKFCSFQRTTERTIEISQLWAPTSWVLGCLKLRHVQVSLPPSQHCGNGLKFWQISNAIICLSFEGAH